MCCRLNISSLEPKAFFRDGVGMLFVGGTGLWVSTVSAILMSCLARLFSGFP